MSRRPPNNRRLYTKLVTSSPIRSFIFVVVQQQVSIDHPANETSNPRDPTNSAVSAIEDKPTSFDDMTLVYKRFLRLFAILPFQGRDYSWPLTRGLLTFTLLSSCVNWSMFVCYVLNKGVPAIDTICETAVVVGFNARYYLLLWKRRELADLLQECREIWDECPQEERPVIRQFERRVRMLFMCLLANSLFGHFLYSASALVFTLQAQADWQHGENDTEPPHFLPYKWYADGGEDFWPGYKFNFSVQVMLVTVVSVMASTVDSTAPLLIMIGAGYFRDLQHRLVRACDSADQLVVCFRLHQRILSYCSRIDKITRTLFFAQLLTTAYNVSLIGIKLSGTDPDKYKYLPVGLFNLAQLFICQWAPDHLIDESEAVATAAYSASPSWMQHRMGKLLVLIIARAQRPVQMTAAGVVHLSLENFGSMLTSAISFFTVLRNFNV